MPKDPVLPKPIPPAHPTTPAPQETAPHPHVTSPGVEHAMDRMKHAARPNDAEPLSHRDRGKAGRKG
jgi:hypothetical protein